MQMKNSSHLEMQEVNDDQIAAIEDIWSDKKDYDINCQKEKSSGWPNFIWGFAWIYNQQQSYKNAFTNQKILFVHPV